MSRRNPHLLRSLESYHLKHPALDADMIDVTSPDPSSPSANRHNSISPSRKRMNPSSTTRPKSAAVMRRSQSAVLTRHRRSHGHLNRETLADMDEDGIETGGDDFGSGVKRQRPGTAKPGSTSANQQNDSSQTIPEVKRSDKIVPSSFITTNPKTRMACRVRVISDREAENMQYVPQSEMMKQLFQKNDLRVYVGPTINTSNRSGTTEERVLTKAEYLELDDHVDVELSNVKHSIMPTAFKRLKKQKLNERIWERFQRLDAIRTNMQRTDQLLQGYEVKRQQNEPVDLLSMDDVTDLVMRDLVSREGVMMQTKQLVEVISEENKKLAREKHNILQDLTNWFKTHDIDVEAMHLNSTESDVRHLLAGVDESPFGYSYKQTVSQMHYNKDKLQSIFADYKSIKDESRQEEKRKYLNEFARKMQDLETNLAGEQESLDDANAKIQLLLKKIIFLQEELEDEKELHQEKARQSQLYRRRFLKYKGLMMKIIERLKENHIREAVDIQYIITGRYADEFEDDFPEEDFNEDDIENADLTTYFGRNSAVVLDANDSLPPPGEEEEDPTIPIPVLAASIEETQSDVVGFADRAIWYTQGPDVETPPEYILEISAASQYPLHQLSPLELKLKTQVDVLNKRLMQMEMELFDQVDIDANEYAEKNSSLQGKNQHLQDMLAEAEQSQATLREQLAEKDAVIKELQHKIDKLSSMDTKMQQEMEKLKRARIVRQLTSSQLAGIDVKQEKSLVSMQEHSEAVDDSSEDGDDSEDEVGNGETPSVGEVPVKTPKKRMSLLHTPATPNSDIAPDVLELKESEEVERLIESGDMSMEDMSVEQRKLWRNENYMLINQKRQLLAEIQALQKAKKSFKISQGPLAAFLNKQEDSPSSADGTPTQPKLSFKAIASRVAAQISEKKPKPKKPALKILTEQLQEERKLKERNSSVLEVATQDDLHILFDKNNAEEYSTTDDIMKAIDEITDTTRAKNIAKLLVLDREALLEQVFGTHKRIRKFFECMHQLYSTKSHSSVYTDTEFISEWIIFNRQLDVDIDMHSLPKQFKQTKDNKDSRRHAKRMTFREELKHQTTYVIEHEAEEGRKKQNPMALTRSSLGLLVRMYLHFKLFRRRNMQNTERLGFSSPGRPSSRGYSSGGGVVVSVGRAKSARKRRSSRQKKDVVTQSLVRMESHRKQMKQRWEEKKRQILQEQRNRFAGYSLVPGSPGGLAPPVNPENGEGLSEMHTTRSGSRSKSPQLILEEDEDDEVVGPTSVLQHNYFDTPPSLDKESVETKRRLASISPRNPKSPRPKSALTRRRTRLSIDLSGAWNPPSVPDEPSHIAESSIVSRGLTSGWEMKNE